MIDIVPFSSPHAGGVVSLILPIQHSEFDIPITLEAQPDLQDIRGFYQHGNGTFRVALDGPRVVGTVALLDIGNNQAALRKMFVDAPRRGAERGVARRGSIVAPRSRLTPQRLLRVWHLGRGPIPRWT